MIYIGVDPGKKGGYAVIDADGNVDVHPWDDEGFIERMRKCRSENGFYARKIVACVEKVGARPGQGVTSMFSFGKSAGFIEGVLTALGIGYQLVPPMTWKREFSLIQAEKRQSVETAKKLFPGVSLLPGARCRTESDGMAEALLMAEYARRKMG